MIINCYDDIIEYFKDMSEQELSNYKYVVTLDNIILYVEDSTKYNLIYKEVKDFNITDEYKVNTIEISYYLNVLGVEEWKICSNFEKILVNDYLPNCERLYYKRDKKNRIVLYRSEILYKIAENKYYNKFTKLDAFKEGLFDISNDEIEKILTKYKIYTLKNQ